MKRIAFIGGGNMAFALVGGLRAASEAGDTPDGQLDIVVADPIPNQLERFEGVSTTETNAIAVDAADAVVLAIKPQVIREVVEALPLTTRQLVISIAAGVPIEAISRWTSAKQPIVRCMPNTPALLRAGISGLTANGFVEPGMRALAERILSAAAGDNQGVARAALAGCRTESVADQKVACDRCAFPEHKERQHVVRPHDPQHAGHKKKQEQVKGTLSGIAFQIVVRVKCDGRTNP